MNKRAVFLIVTALGLGFCYFYFFTDAFQHKEIQLKFREMPDRRGKGTILCVILDNEYALKSIKVCRADEIATNKFAHPYWQVQAKDATKPVDTFVYGGKIKGMEPKVAGLAPEKLEKGVTYRFIIETDKLRGEKEYTMK